MHFPGHNTVRGSQLASEGQYFPSNESRVKNIVPYLEGQFVGGGHSKFAANIKFEIFLHNIGPIFFSIFVGNPLFEARFFFKFA